MTADKVKFCILTLALVVIGFGQSIADSPAQPVNVEKHKADELKKSEDNKKLLDWIRKHEDHGEPEKIYKQAQEILADQKAGNAILVYRLLLTKSEYWQQHNLPGGQELADYVVQKLMHDNMTESPERGIEYSLLLANAYRLSQEYEQAADVLEACLENYYPEALKRRKIIPIEMEPPARLILEDLGKVYLQQAQQSLDLKEKAKWYSLAAGGFIRAASGYYDKQTKQSAGIPSKLLLDITTCRDALFLLGRQLQIPVFLEKQLRTDNEGLILKLISQRKYKAAIKLIDRSEQSPVMMRFKLICLIELNQPKKVLLQAYNLAKKHGNQPQSQNLILEAALRLEKDNPEISSKLFYIFAKIAPENKQSPQALLKRAGYCSQNKQLESAIAIYKQIITDYPGQQQLTWDCLFKVAQCYYQLAEYSKALDSSMEAQAAAKDEKQKQETQLLTAQCFLQLAIKAPDDSKERLDNAISAQKYFASLMPIAKTSNDLYRQIILGAELSTELAGNITQAVGYYKKYLSISNASPKSCSVMAKRLIKLAAANKQPELIKQVIAGYLEEIKTNDFEMSLLAMEEALKLGDGKTVLAIANRIALDDEKKKGIDQSNLIAIVEMLNSSGMDMCRKETSGVILKLVKPYLPELNTKNPALFSRLLITAAKAAKDLSDHKTELVLLNQALDSRSSCYLEAKLMRGDLFAAHRKYEKARNDYQEIVIMTQDRTMILKASARLADTYKMEKDWKRVAASALFCLPLFEQFDELSDEQKKSMKQCLEMAGEAYRKLGDFKQLLSIANVYLKAYPDGQQADMYKKLVARHSKIKKRDK